jgi:hypothetical protein
MNTRYDQSSRSRFSAIGVTTGSILALIVAMAISVVFDIQPADAKTRNQVAHTNVIARS